MPRASHRPLSSVLARSMALALLLLGACQTTPTAPPPAPVIVAAVTNAAVTAATASAPTIVTIGSISWQKTNPQFPSTFSWGWLEDPLVGNPFAFQVRINTDLSGSAFSILDAGGTALASVTARSNTSHTCGTAGGECYWSPGNASYIAPAPVPTASAVYTVGLVNTCADVITPSRTAFAVADRTAVCAAGQAAGAAVLLTISPARPLVAGTKRRFTLVAKNAAGARSTPFDVVLVPPPVFVPPIFVGGGTSSPGTSNMPPAAPACSNQPNGQEQSFSFQMTCSAGGTSSTDTRAASACTRAQARQQLASIYAIELTQGCVLGQ